MADTVRVRPDSSVDTIAPETYGHFAEHLGRCIYGGVWVGEDADVDAVDGLRTDTLELLEALELQVLRWPGGCFADDYHWEDGVGPREERPRRRNLFWAQGRSERFEESNDFGTEEFLRLCRRVDAEPYLAGNVGTGSPDELLDWVEYCNHDGDTEPASMQAEYGREQPHGVRYWGVGNENWGCGGRFDPDDYGREYRRFANYLRAAESRLTDPLELVAVGHITEDWNREVLEAIGDPDLLDHLSVHRYISAGPATGFDEEEYYRLLARARRFGEDVDRAAATVEALMPGADVGVMVDEWGVWHPEAVSENGLEQANTVRDGLVAASALDQFNARADVLSMANLAQTVNVLQCVVETDAENAWPTPTYRVFDLYRSHAGATAVPVDVETDRRTFDDEDHDLPLVSASASRDEDLFVTLSNRDRDDARSVRVDPGPGRTAGTASADVLFGDLSPDARSTRQNAGQFAAESLEVSVEDGDAVVEAPPSSVVGLHVDAT
jgi:alpha-N-arabinofuranosidase